MSKTYDVAILGGGVVAHSLALLLARDRLRVALVQPNLQPGSSRSTAPDIRAYALNAASHSLLASLRAWPSDASEPPAVTPVQHMWVCESAPEQPASTRFDAPAAEPLCWIVDVPALEQRLAQALSFQPGIEVLETAPKARLTVICEGKRSSSRAAAGIEFERKPYPQTALAARFRTERPHGGVARQWFSGGDILALLPLEGADGHAVALVWSVPHERAAQLLALPPQTLADAVSQASDHALGQLLPIGTAAGWPLELSRAKRWVQPGLALAGDAAHTMHPLAGQGLNAGLADVATLAQVLREREYWRDVGDLRLLRRYERARQADIQTMSWVTDSLFGLFGHTDSRVQMLRRVGLNGFDRLNPLKRWALHRAMASPATHHP